jgi:signal transduction histidine kinase
MIRRALAGLRGRLLLALVFTSAATLAVAAAITLSPLQSRLRAESTDAVQRAADALSPDFSKAFKVRKGQPVLLTREINLQDPGYELRSRTAGARVLVADRTLTNSDHEAPAFLFDSYPGVPTADALALALQARREQTAETLIRDDELTFARPLYDEQGIIVGTLVVQRSLTEVTTTVRLVRNALFTAAGVGLAVAIGLGLALSSTLTRRLALLQRGALRITAEGADAPAPVDRGRDEVGDLARAIGRMQEELRRQESARRSFVSTASHELRTPLTMLQGTMELLEEDLRDGRDLDDAQEQVAGARRELRRLAVLASELLDLSRLDAAVQLRSEPVELTEITRAVAAEFALRAAERDVALDVADSSGPCWAHADPAACARVVRILIDNALRYAPPGEPIELSTIRTQRSVIVRVADRGPGVAEDERERIFERFHRGKATSAESGFGLGLAIGRELAERMGGRLELEETAIGACFVLTLPASASSPSRSPAPDSAAAA